MESKPVYISDKRLVFIDPLAHELPKPESNLFVEQYFSFGSPVILGREAKNYRENWSEAFGREAELCLEIGAGNGFFLAGMAKKYPERNWLGIEIRYKRVVQIAKKIKIIGAENARITRYDNWCLDDLFVENELSALYTNHPDPWPKKRQANKRILSTPFVNWAAYVMKSGAEWRIKTDFGTHIDTMLEVIKDLPFTVVGVSRDAHKNGFPWDKEEDLTTNYERKFIERNLPIHALRLVRN